jgi:hypothetical protein
MYRYFKSGFYSQETIPYFHYKISKLMGNNRCLILRTKRNIWKLKQVTDIILRYEELNIVTGPDWLVVSAWRTAYSCHIIYSDTPREMESKPSSIYEVLARSSQPAPARAPTNGTEMKWFSFIWACSLSCQVWRWNLATRRLKYRSAGAPNPG